MSQATENDPMYDRLKRTASVGYVVVFAWYGIVGGFMSIISGGAFGWVGLVIGIGIIPLAFTSAFRGYLNLLASMRAFPLMVFLPNLFIVAMYSYFASIYLGDPFLTYNDSETLAAVLFSGAAILAIGAFGVNLVAYVSDRRS